MASQYNIVFDVGLSEKSIADVQNKLAKSLEKKKIDIKGFTNFDGIASITNEAKEVIKYIGSINNGTESIGFVLDKNLKKLQTFNSVFTPAMRNIQWFSDNVREIGTDSKTANHIAEAKKQIENLVGAFGSKTAEQITRGIAGDKLGMFFKDNELTTYIKGVAKDIFDQGSNVSDAYDTLKNNIAQKKSELEQTLSSMSSSSFSGTLQDAKDNVKNLQSEFSQAIAGFATTAGVQTDVSSMPSELGNWVGDQVSDFDNKAQDMISAIESKSADVKKAVSNFKRSVSTIQGNSVKQIGQLDASQIESKFGVSVNKSKDGLQKILSGLGISQAEISSAMAEAENAVQTAWSKVAQKIQNRAESTSDVGNQINKLGENAKKSAQSTSDAASQMNDSADKMQDAAEKTRKAAEEYNRANDELDDAQNRRDDTDEPEKPKGIKWESGATDKEKQAIDQLVKLKVGNDWNILKTTVSRNFDADGYYDSIHASVLMINSTLDKTVERMYTISDIASEADINMEKLRETSERAVQTFGKSGKNQVDKGKLQDLAKQRLNEYMAGVPESMRGDSKLSGIQKSIENFIPTMEDSTSLRDFNILLQTLRSRIQEIKKQTGGEKLDPLAGMDKTVNELPARLAKVEAAYGKLYNKTQASQYNSKKSIQDLYNNAVKAVNDATTQYSNHEASAEDKVKAIKQAQNAVTLLNREVGVASKSVDDLLEGIHKSVSANIVNPSASGLDSWYKDLQNKINDAKKQNGGTLNPNTQQEIRDEIEAYRQLYKDKLKEQKSYNNQIQKAIRATETKTQVANGYDRQSGKYAQMTLQIRQQQVKTENLIAEARQKGLISISQEEDYLNKLQGALQNTTASKTPELNQFDKLAAKFNNLRDSLSKMKLTAGNDDLKSFWEEVELRARRYLSTVEDAKRNLLDDPTSKNATMYKDALNNLESYISTINELISVYPKFVSIQGQFNPAALLSDANTMFVRGGRRDDMLPEIDAYKKDIDQLGNMILEIGQYDFSTGSIEAYVKEVQKVISAYERVRSAGKTLKDQTDAIFQRSQDITGYRSILQDYGAYMYKFGASISSNDMLFEKFFKFREQLNKPLENFTGPDQAKRTFEELQAAAKRCGVEVESVRKRVGDLIDRFSFAAVMASAIGYASRMMRQMYQNVIEVDTALVELKKVTDASDNSMNQFLDNASKRAKELGVTLSDLTNATAAFARMGYSIADSTVLGEQASIFRNVGDDVDSIDDATSIMISTMKAFGIEAENVSSIIDKLNEVSNTYAITSGGIGNALTRSASAAFSAGNTLDQTIAMITTANQVVDVCHHI